MELLLFCFGFAACRRVPSISGLAVCRLAPSHGRHSDASLDEPKEIAISPSFDRIALIVFVSRPKLIESVVVNLKTDVSDSLFTILCGLLTNTLDFSLARPI